MAASPTNGSSFTCNGRFFALLSVDNRLRVWDVSSGKLLREFSSASHIESSCTCLCWTPKSSKDGKKVKRSGDDGLSNILIGHSNGKILLYNPTSDQCDQIYNDGHTRKVNCITHDSGSGKFYSCADKQITEWSFESKELIRKWKGDKNTVNMVAVGPNGKTLLSAGMSIKLWDLETKKEIMQFNGHSSPVSILQFSGYRTKGKVSNDADGCYFLSGGAGDRVISAWHINYSQPEKSAIATFMTSEVPVFVHTFINIDHSQPVKMAVGCRDGKVFLFVCSMNGKVSRPIEEFKMLVIKQKEVNYVSPATLLNGILSMDDKSIMLKFASGNSLKPNLNDFNFSKGNRVERIFTSNSENLFMKQHSLKSNQTVELAEMRGKQHVIGKTFAIPKLDVNDNIKDRQKTEDKSMMERLKEAGMYSQSSQVMSTSTNSASSFSVLLIQAIHTNDTELIDDILSRKVSQKIVHNTVHRMPPGIVVEFLNQIVDKIQSNPHPTVSSNLSVWIRTILTVHLSSLSLLPNVSTSLGKLFSLLKAQQEIFPYLFSLQGKMELLITQVTKDSLFGDGTNKEEDEEESMKNPCLVFHDDSDDDDELLERIRRDSENTPGDETDDDSGDDDTDGKESSTSDDTDTEDEESVKGDDVDSDDDSGTF